MSLIFLNHNHVDKLIPVNILITLTSLMVENIVTKYKKRSLPILSFNQQQLQCCIVCFTSFYALQ